LDRNRVYAAKVWVYATKVWVYAAKVWVCTSFEKDVDNVRPTAMDGQIQHSMTLIVDMVGIGAENEKKRYYFLILASEGKFPSGM
jgi:hypothetical protein